MKIGFDIISDLYLSPDDSFNWEGKATSLYCLIAGNVSADLRTLRQTLMHLGRFYQGVFYVPGKLEYENCQDINLRTEQIKKVCQSVKKVAILHNHVVIIDGIAILGANCWYDKATNEYIFEIDKQIHRTEDIAYLVNTLDKLQLHLDVKTIIVMTSTVPSSELFFGLRPEGLEELIPPKSILSHDLENKISYWVYGNFTKEVNVTIENINYISNPYINRNPYWAKRIEI